MNNKFFPNDDDKLSFVMKIYEEEIHNRNIWVKESAIKLNEALNRQQPASIVINYAMSIINHAMLVLRLVDIEASGARDKEKAQERAQILHLRNPGFLEPPESLRDIRNDYEHFEARLDKWATSNNPMTYIDLIVGRPIFVSNANDQDIFRHFAGSKLMFWNKSVDLQEVVDWVEIMSTVITENNRKRL